MSAQLYTLAFIIVNLCGLCLFAIFHNEKTARENYKPLTPNEIMKRQKFTKSGTPLNRAKRRQILREMQKRIK